MNSQTHFRLPSRVAAVALFLLLLPGLLLAKSTQKSDYLNFGISTGYSVLVGDYKGMDVFGGFSSALQFGYEYRDGKLWIGSSGEFQYISSNCQSDISIPDVRFLDTRLTEAVMHYDMNSKLREMQNFGIANITLMAGYCTSTHVKSGFYVGAGFKLGCKFDFSNSLKQRYTTTASYPDYIDPYHDMPNHYYNVYETNDTVAFGTKLNVSVLVEGGWDLKVTRCDKLKVGFFFEAGLTNIMHNTPIREPGVNADNVSQIYTFSAYNRPEMRDKYIVPIVAGIKFSFLYNVSRLKNRCQRCCYRKR